MGNNSNRRSFLKKTLLGTGGVLLIPNFISCTTDIYNNDGIIPEDLITTNYEYGVASFDPTDSQVIIWTRYGTSLPSVEILWQISTDETFKNTIRSGLVTTSSERDYTIAIEIKNLKPDQKLFYRFVNINEKTVSPIGETITLPVENVEQIKLGIASCSNYEFGFFNVYHAMTNSDIDIVIHLGDYIYENGSTFTNVNSGRAHKPSNELITLEDYRLRYKQYRRDKNLKALHQKKPFICVWDDHEIADNSYKEGALNHQNNEGSFTQRKLSALQAYSEYLPTKTNEDDLIYRSFEIGNLLHLVMLDTRLIGRDQQLEYSNYYNTAGELDTANFQQDLMAADRTMLGSLQKDWLLNEINRSTTDWLLLGQQVLMGKMFFPAELLIKITALQKEFSLLGAISLESTTSLLNQLDALVLLKTRSQNNDPTLTMEELQRVHTVLPYNLDAWDGYPIERDSILNALSSKKAIVLAGDTHNAWFNRIETINANAVVHEFATASVTSPGFEILNWGDSVNEKFQDAIAFLVDGLDYFNSSKRGFMEMEVNSTSLTIKWVFVDTIKSENYKVEVKHTTTL